MDSKKLLLSAIIFASVGLVGCQTAKNDQALSGSDVSEQIKRADWKESGELFRIPDDNNLKPNEVRLVFFRDASDGDPVHNIDISFGLDNVFHSSLQRGHYSEQIVCNSAHIINGVILDGKDEKIIPYTQKYQFIPQTTNYLKVGLSKSGSPVIQQLSAEEALPMLSQSYPSSASN